MNNGPLRVCRTFLFSQLTFNAARHPFRSTNVIQFPALNNPCSSSELSLPQPLPRRWEMSWAKKTICFLFGLVTEHREKYVKIPPPYINTCKGFWVYCTLLPWFYVNKYISLVGMVPLIIFIYYLSILYKSRFDLYKILLFITYACCT